ncbi:CRISPR-associated primase-polymerase type A1 [Fervidobacterium sp. 2310opik-2]|uniref:CRISPR-associated primase-polymerase type A1 n=1 Tax=Fervidobacterium sp. 2310opik-2 TaxID=1755815 RepID=UPI0013E084C0|nr:CRISPR-associated primase-polymerase type A1 [Fervidobacterium sp. 2310opik-2]KAF2961071.1 hypothetical protein AS161_03595 [Fervidobacterium sp. 2310opik-2]
MLSEMKKQALEHEKRFNFRAALELYKQCENELTIEDGSLIRYALLLYEFQEYQKAQQILEKIVIVHKYFKKKILKLLAEVYEINGYNDKALYIYEKLGEKNKVSQLKSEEELQNPKAAYVKKFIELFSGREDVFALQTDNGYFPVRKALTDIDVIEHLSGKKTIGIYVLKSNDTVKFGAIDIDISKSFMEKKEYILETECKSKTIELYKILKSEGIASYIEFSGNKGYHIWVFLDKPIPAYKMKYMLEKLSSRVQISEGIKIEIFPKQIQLNGGLGNLIKAPLGIHRKTKNRCVFVDENLNTVDDQVKFLLNIQTNQSEHIDKIFKSLFGSSEQLEEVEISGEKIPKVSKNNSKPNENSVQSNTLQVKKSLRKKINESYIGDAAILSESCSILSQILGKIEKEATISEDEERILISILVRIKDGRNIIDKILQKTINYSTQRIDNHIKTMNTIPITCEEIKKTILNKKLPIDLSKCVCRFCEPLNTPLNYIDSNLYIQSLDIKDLASVIIEKTKEKLEIESQIKKLKNILSMKMEQSEIETELGRIRKTQDDDLEITI